MIEAKIIAKKNKDNVWSWYNLEKKEFIRPILLTDDSFKTLNAKVKFEIRQYYQTHKAVSNNNANNVSNKYKKLNKYLKDNITGQDNVIDQWTKMLSSHDFNGWDSPNVALCLGSTGVGKTLMARKTNEFLNGDESNFYKIDCGDSKFNNTYNNQETIWELADFIKNHPTGIILLDEIEKIILSKNPDGGYVFNGNSAFFSAFLNIFDEGYITDRDGKKVPCNKNTFIMTSNLGAEYLAVNDRMSVKMLLNQVFPPEFLGRIDKGIYYFNTLRFKDLMEATKLVLNDKDGLITKQLDKNKIQIKISPESLKNIVLSACGLFHNIDQLAYDNSAYFNAKASDELQQTLYFHESGHCIAELAQMTETEKKSGVYGVKKLTVKPEGNALGYSLSLPSEKTNGTRIEAIQEAIKLHAGRAAEEIFCKDRGEGWSNDKTRENEIIADIMLHFHTPNTAAIPEVVKDKYSITKEGNKYSFAVMNVTEQKWEDISEENIVKAQGAIFVKEMKKELEEKQKAIDKTKKINQKVVVNKLDRKIVKEVSDIAGFDISKVSFSQYWTEDPQKRAEKISKLEDTKPEWNEIFRAYEVYIQNKSRELLLDHEKELKLFVESLKTKGTLEEKEIKYIWDHKKLPQNIIDIQSKPKEEQKIAQIDAGLEPVSSHAGARAVKNYIKQELAYQFQDLFESNKIKPNSEVELIVDDNGKLSIKQEKQKSASKAH